MTIQDAQYIDGKVALRYYMPVPKAFQIGDNFILFSCKPGLPISMALVDENLVPKLLEVTGGCCGGKRKVIALASWEATNLWRTGTRDGIVI